MHLDFVLLLAHQITEQAKPARELDPVKRLKLLSALAMVLILGAIAIMVIRATKGLVRWYVQDRRVDDKLPPLNVDDWADKPLAPPLEDNEPERPIE